MFQRQRGGTEIRADKDEKFGEDRPLEEAPELGDEEKHELQKRMEAMDKLLAANKKAKYKIELFFGKARSMRSAVPGAISFWESGTKFHGGGDTKIYFCPGKLTGKNDCQKVIPFAFNGYGFMVCPGCKETWKGGQVIGEVFGRHTMRDWALLIFQYYNRLDQNCDIYLKHSPDDIRSVAAREQERQQGGELLTRARERARHVYPLRNIIKDTLAGADLLNRFYAFLTA
jgi:hypothetical protein